MSGNFDTDWRTQAWEYLEEQVASFAGPGTQSLPSTRVQAQLRDRPHFVQALLPLAIELDAHLGVGACVSAPARLQQKQKRRQPAVPPYLSQTVGFGDRFPPFPVSCLTNTEGLRR